MNSDVKKFLIFGIMGLALIDIDVAGAAAVCAFGIFALNKILHNLGNRKE